MTTKDATADVRFAHLTRRDRTRIAILERRRLFLLSEQARGATNSFDDSELSALGWALGELAAHVELQRAHFQLKSHIAMRKRFDVPR